MKTLKLLFVISGKLRFLNEAIRWNNETVCRMNRHLNTFKDVGFLGNTWDKIELDFHIATWEDNTYNINFSEWEHGDITVKFVPDDVVHNYDAKAHSWPSHICKAEAVDKLDVDLTKYHSIILTRPDWIFFFDDEERSLVNFLNPHVQNINCIDGQIKVFKLQRAAGRDWQCDDQYITFPVKTFNWIKKRIVKNTNQWFMENRHRQLQSNHIIFLGILTHTLFNEDNKSWGIIYGEIYLRPECSLLRKPSVEIINNSQKLVYNYQNFKIIKKLEHKHLWPDEWKE